MHTQTVLGLVKILPLTMFRPLWSSAGHQFLWAETRHWCLVFLVFDICRPESLRVLTTSCKYLSLARLDVFNLRYSSLNFLLLVFPALWCACLGEYRFLSLLWWHPYWPFSVRSPYDGVSILLVPLLRNVRWHHNQLNQWADGLCYWRSHKPMWLSIKLSQTSESRRRVPPPLEWYIWIKDMVISSKEKWNI